MNAAVPRTVVGPAAVEVLTLRPLPHVVRLTATASA
jgi:hypothetical protein